MSENTPSQAEGEPEADAPEAEREQPPRTTPSQAEGADPDDDPEQDDA
ncbi:hypothetical protein [Streptomyces sp. NPDC006193]